MTKKLEIAAYQAKDGRVFGTDDDARAHELRQWLLDAHKSLEKVLVSSFTKAESERASAHRNMLGDRDYQAGADEIRARQLMRNLPVIERMLSDALQQVVKFRDSAGRTNIVTSPETKPTKKPTIQARARVEDTQARIANAIAAKEVDAAQVKKLCSEFRVARLKDLTDRQCGEILYKLGLSDAYLKQVILELDPETDNHWTADGRPAVAEVCSRMNEESVTRKQIEASVPGWTREKARELKSI